MWPQPPHPLTRSQGPRPRGPRPLQQSSDSPALSCPPEATEVHHFSFLPGLPVEQAAPRLPHPHPYPPRRCGRSRGPLLQEPRPLVTLRANEPGRPAALPSWNLAEPATQQKAPRAVRWLGPGCCPARPGWPRRGGGEGLQRRETFSEPGRTWPVPQRRPCWENNTRGPAPGKAGGRRCAGGRPGPWLCRSPGPSQRPTASRPTALAADCQLP